MTTKDELVTNIKQWIEIDTTVRQLQKQIKELRKQKRGLADNLVNVMKDNEIDCFNLSEGKLLYTKTKTKSPLSKKHLTECLDKYFAQHSEINSGEVCEFILESREVKENESIRHKPNKKI